MKKHSEDYNKIIQDIKNRSRKKKISRLVLTGIFNITGIILSLIWYDWKLILILLIFMSASNLERRIK